MEARRVQSPGLALFSLENTSSARGRANGPQARWQERWCLASTGPAGPAGIDHPPDCASSPVSSLTFFIRVNNKPDNLSPRLCLQLAELPTCCFPVTALLPGVCTHLSGPVTVSSLRSTRGSYPLWMPRIPPSISPFTRAKAAAGRHLSCLPSRHMSLCAQGTGCHGNPQFPFQWGLAAGASPFSGVSQSRSHQATHCF